MNNEPFDKIQNVATLVITMDAKIIKIGNSYGVRLSKEYMRANGLKPGGRLVLPRQPKGNVSNAIQQLQQAADKRGSMKSIKDPVDWQRAIRSETEEWDRVIRDDFTR